MADVIQVRPQELKDLCRRLEEQMQAISNIERNVESMCQRLKSGWIGLGSETFFETMDQKILPAVGRLSAAFNMASITMDTVSQSMSEADREGGHLFSSATEAARAAAAQGLGGFGRTGLLGGTTGESALDQRLRQAGFGGLEDFRNAISGLGGGGDGLANGHTGGLGSAAGLVATSSANGYHSAALGSSGGGGGAGGGGGSGGGGHSAALHAASIGGTSGLGSGSNGLGFGSLLAGGGGGLDGMGLSHSTSFPTHSTPSDLMVPKDWLSGVDSSQGQSGAPSGDAAAAPTGSGSGGGSGGGSGSGSGGGSGGQPTQTPPPPNDMASALGALHYQAFGGTGFGIGGTPTGAAKVTYGPSDGLDGGLAANRQDFGVPIALAAISPFAVLLGKVIKNRGDNDDKD